MAGNRGFGDTLADGVVASGARRTRSALPTDSVLEARSQTLGQLAAGKLVTETVKWVDAKRCRPWAHHNRNQALLTEDSCRDLIEAFLSEKRQRLPAIVRRVAGDPDFDYEIIAGVRRHWTVLWLNAHNHPDFQFLVNVQQLTDEEAFRIADVENRARQDLTDLERARDYAKALGLFYDGKQKTMADRLRLEPGWLSRLLDLARLPKEVVAAFGDERVLKIEHAKQLGPLLRDARSSQRVLEAARVLAEAQQQAAQAGQALVRPADVVRDMLRAAAPKPRAKAKASQLILSSTRQPMIKVDRKRGGGLVIELVPKSGASLKELEASIRSLLESLPADKPLG